jgi:hypothetical protein
MMTSMFFLILTAFPVAHCAGPASTTVRLQRDTIAVEKTGKSKNFFSATIFVGQPAQEFRVNFDLGGGTMMLPSATCTDPACKKRRRYDKWASDSAVDIQASGRPVDPSNPKVQERAHGREKGTLDFLEADLGSGTVEGNFVRDRLCLTNGGKDADSAQLCFPLALLAAYKMSDMPFRAEPYDGTIGLGLVGMSINSEFNFLESFMLTHRGVLSNNFALRLQDDNGGEITFGGFDVQSLSQPLEWVTVAAPEEGRWQVAISAIRVGNNTLSACRAGDCRAAIDYGASLLSVPPGLAGGMEQALENVAVPSGYGDGCQITVMPDLQLVLNNDVTLTLPAEDYISQVTSSGRRGIMAGPASSCKPRLTHHDFDVESVAKDTFVLGESVLRRYLTVFDGDSLKVGFSLASNSKSSGAKSLPLLEDKSKKWLKTADDEEDGKAKGESNYILLVQVKIKKSKTTSSLGA